MMAMALSPTQLWPKIRGWAAAGSRLFGKYLLSMGAWFVPMFVTASATAWVSYKYNQKSNIELAAQQQHISELQAFRTSGADLDQALGNFSDALVDGRGVEDARAKMRNAISRHIADASANERELGPFGKEYVSSLGDLRLSVDAADRQNVETITEVWQKSLNLMATRRKLVSTAQERLGI